MICIILIGLILQRIDNTGIPSIIKVIHQSEIINIRGQSFTM
ncbi:Uncharacterised protein [Segatella copri]|nr:Uncharacterised protein [Segatella copri]